MRFLWYIIFSSILFCNTGFCQNLPEDLNLDFEDLNSSRFPSNWTHSKILDDTLKRTNVFIVDSIFQTHGKYSLCIDKTVMRTGVFTTKKLLQLPENCKRITLKGFLKTQDVTEFAGLWLRIDGIDGPIAIENMMQRKIIGTNDWKEYSIALEYDPNVAKSAAVGGILAGSGKLWIDDLHIFFDTCEYNLNTSQAQENHLRKEKSRMDKRTINNFTLLASLWGFLKYHHPNFKSGKVNADSELIRLLEAVNCTKNNKETQKIFANWIESLGVSPLDKQIKVDVHDTINSLCTPKYNILFNKKYFNKEIIQKTKQILSNLDTDGDQYYVTCSGNVASFERDGVYNEISPIDWRRRLLALFKFWNAIEYFYPYRYLIDDWEGILFKQIPIFYYANDKFDYLYACQKLVCEIEDSHGSVEPDISTRRKYTNIAPLKIAFIEGKAIVNEIFEDSLNNVKVGDIITMINGVDIDLLIDEYLKYTSGSNIETKFRDISWRYLLRTNQPTMSLSILRNSQLLNINIPTITIVNYTQMQCDRLLKKRIKLLDDTICYIPLNGFNLSEINGLLTKENCRIRRIILDLRMPALFQRTIDSVFIFIGNHATNGIPYAMLSYPNLRIPGYFPMLHSNIISNNPYFPNWRCPLKIIILVDENTQSATECLAMALQQIPNSVTIGSKTAGTDGNITHLMLPGSLETTFTGLGVYYPDKGETQKLGIRINKLVKPSIKGIQGGIDEQFEFARNY